MSPSVVAIIVSFAFVCFLIGLYRFEAARGARLVEPVRHGFDQLFIRLSAIAAVPMTYLRSGFFRQIIHFIFSVVLTRVLGLFKRVVTRVESMLRSNRILARKARAERTTRNKLDDIADHKQSVALSDKEKHERKKDTLEGKL